LKQWAKAFAEGHDILAPFIDGAVKVIEKIAALGYASPDHIGVAGLSRGALIAAFIAARSPLIRHILGFAPLTRLAKARDFKDFPHPSAIAGYDMRHLIDKLIGKNLRFHIGNRDELVGTAACFSFIEQLAEASYQNRIRSPQAELIVYPAIGYLGHGTPKAIFEQGAEWLSQKLEAVDG
jgi:esterase FrsA